MKKNLSSEKIKKLLTTEFIGKNIVYFKTTDSTNLQAKLHQDLLSGTVFIAEHQTKGRGRLSRLWESEPNSGIYMSILIKPEKIPENPSSITLLSGLSVCTCIEKISACMPFIKWPNDIVMNSKKVCGILCELTGEKNDCIVLGIGINVNTRSFDAPLRDIATSIALENHAFFDRESLISDILSEFERLYKIFLKSGFAPFLSDFEKRCITINREVEIISPSERYTAKATAINENGALIVEHNGTKKAISSGEVSVRGICGYI